MKCLNQRLKLGRITSAAFGFVTTAVVSDLVTMNPMRLLRQNRHPRRGSHRPRQIRHLNRRRGQISNMENKANACILKAMVPLSEMFGYSTAIRTLSSGRASYSMEPSHFEQVPQNLVDQIVTEKAK